MLSMLISLAYFTYGDSSDAGNYVMLGDGVLLIFLYSKYVINYDLQLTVEDVNTTSKLLDNITQSENLTRESVIKQLKMFEERDLTKKVFEQCDVIKRKKSNLNHNNYKKI